jgi:hypothetical protein
MCERASREGWVSLACTARSRIFLLARCRRRRVRIPRVIQGHAALAKAEAVGRVGATAIPAGSRTLRRQICDVTGHKHCRISNWKLH